MPINCPSDSYLMFKGWVRIFVAAVILGSVGLLLSLWGWEALNSGEVAIHLKGKREFVAASVGPHSTWYFFKTWALIVAGGFCVALSIYSLGTLFFTRRSYREKRLLQSGLSIPLPSAVGPIVSGPFITVVLALLLAAFAFIIYKHG